MRIPVLLQSRGHDCTGQHCTGPECEFVPLIEPIHHTYAGRNCLGHGYLVHNYVGLTHLFDPLVEPNSHNSAGRSYVGLTP